MNFKSKRLAMINKDRTFFQYNSGDLVYIISPLTSQLHTASSKATIKYGSPVVIYKIIDPHIYLLMTLGGKILRGLFEHERLKPANIRTSQGNVQNLAQLKQIMHAGFKFKGTLLLTINKSEIAIQKSLYMQNFNTNCIHLGESCWIKITLILLHNQHH